ncbi:hypothetical protein IKE67_00155 [bacterium]|nr:hypothetical protein [bacterium]
MPYIQTKLSAKLDEEKKEKIQNLLTDVVASSFGKPKGFVMTEITDGQDLYMGGKKLENGAYLAVSLLGNTSKPVCGQITKAICDILKQELGTEGQNVYVSYHPVELWGWNGQMF